MSPPSDTPPLVNDFDFDLKEEPRAQPPLGAPDLPGYDPERPIHASTHAAQEAGPLGSAVALVVRVIKVHDSESIDDQPHHRLELRDQDNHETVYTLPVRDPHVVRDAHSSVREGTHLVAYGCFLPHGSPRRGALGPPIHLHLHSLHPVPRPSALIGALPSERQQAAGILAQLRSEGKPDSIYNYLCEKLYRLLGIRPVWSRRYETLVRLVILQALSQGQVRPRVNPRLSVALYSESGKGKKIMSQIAGLLSLAGKEAQPASLSPAGMGARVEQRAGSGWVAEPGVYPLSHGGCAVVEDLHQVPKNHLAAFQGLTTGVLEDGLVNPNKAAAACYAAACAVLFNGNAHSSVAGMPPPKGIQARLKDYCLTMDLFTRLDCVAHADTTDDPAQAAKQIATQSIEEIEQAVLRASGRHKRWLKVFVGHLLDEIPQVDLSGVTAGIEQLMDDLIKVLRQVTAKLVGQERAELDSDIFLRRMANSVRKLVGAAARLGGRSVATEEDVEWAWVMMAFKLEHIKWLCAEEDKVQPLRSREDMVELAEMEAADRFDEILAKYGGLGPMEVEQVAHGIGCATKVVRRELKERGIYSSGGQCRIPTELEYARKKEEAEQAAAEQAQAEMKAAAEAAERAAAEREAAEQAAAQAQGEGQAAAQAQGEGQAAAQAQAGGQPKGTETPAQPQPMRALGDAPEQIVIEDEIDARPLPARPGKKVRHKDCIPEMPVAFRPILTLLAYVLPENQIRVAQLILKVALERDHPWLYMELTSLRQDMDPENMPPEPWTSEVMEAWTHWLMDEDWMKRGMNAIVTFMHSSLEEMGWWLEAELKKRPDLPEELRQALLAVIAREDAAAGRVRKTREEIEAEDQRFREELRKRNAWPTLPKKLGVGQGSTPDTG